MSKKKLYAHILLDRSGSMESIRDKTIDSVNEYIGGLAGDPEISARVSLTLFDSITSGVAIEDVFVNVKAKEAPKLTRETYAPRGSTPLNDAIGKTVIKIDGHARRDGENVAIVILTDGMENASSEYNKDSVKALLAGRQKDKNWLVIYLGANQDAFAEGAARGTQVNNTINFVASAAPAAMSASLRATRAYAKSGNTAVAAFTAEEREAASK